jgi:hypothetical protein
MANVRSERDDDYVRNHGTRRTMEVEVVSQEI